MPELVCPILVAYLYIQLNPSIPHLVSRCSGVGLCTKSIYVGTTFKVSLINECPGYGLEGCHVLFLAKIVFT